MAAKKAETAGDYGTFEDPSDKDRRVIAPTVDDAVRMAHDGWKLVAGPNPPTE